ncbi:hypothetical protein FHS86_000290 [Roseimarinus sediminis]
MKHILFLFFSLCLMGNTAMAQVPDDIIVSLKTGNAASLSKYFSQNVELVVLETENVYSRSHAQQVLNDFFKKYPPQNFSLIHEGGKDNSSYAIGNLQVKGDKFRVYFLLKEVNGKAYIHQLRIERQSK